MTDQSRDQSKFDVAYLVDYMKKTGRTRVIITAEHLVLTPGAEPELVILIHPPVEDHTQSPSDSAVGGAFFVLTYVALGDDCLPQNGEVFRVISPRG